MTPLMISLFLTLTGSLVPGQAPRRVASGDELVKREREWNEAFKKRDKTALRLILLDDFIFTDYQGQVHNKAAFIEAATKSIRVISYKLEDTTIRVRGSVGVVAGRWTGRMTFDGKDASGSFRYTDTFIKTAAGWRAFASQDTRIPESAK